MRAAKIVGGVLVVLLAMQLYRPAKTNPPEDPTKTFSAHTTMTPEVAHIFNTSCHDCHTYTTVWPKYSYVAPVSWLVTDDVNEGRRHLNLSDWSSYTVLRQQAKLETMCDEIKDGGMPLRQYTWLHPGTALDQQQRQAICAWTLAEQQRITARTGVAPPSEPKKGMHPAQ
jgi:hypothetical protein